MIFNLKKKFQDAARGRTLGIVHHLQGEKYQRSNILVGIPDSTPVNKQVVLLKSQALKKSTRP